MTVTQTTFQGYQNEKMQKDYKRLIRKFMNLGDTKVQAEKNAKQMIDYYAHTYREYK